MEVRCITSKKNWLLPLCGFLFPCHALALDEYLDLTLEQLVNTKVISVSKKSETVAAAAAAVYVITSEEIARAGITTIPDALRMVPGVFVARSDSNTWAISIRGFNSPLANKLLVLVDGRTIYNPVFGGVLWDAHDLMLEDIARIEVVRGPGGTLWGANAVNGVINITTKHTRDTKGGIASALYGNEERGTVSVRQGGNFGDEGSYRVYGKVFERDASDSPSGGEAYDAWNGVRGGFRADWDNRYTLQGDIYSVSEQQRKVNFSLVAPYMPVADQTITYDGINLLARWTDKTGAGGQWHVQSYIDWTRRNEPFNFIDNRSIYDMEAHYNFPVIGAQDIIVGASFRYLTSNEEGNNNVAFSPQRRHDRVYSAFVQDKIALAPETIFLTLGAKIERNEFSGEEIQPNIRLQWHPTKNQTLWTSVSDAVRTPTPLEKDLTSTLITAAGLRGTFIPNEDFKPEELTAYEVGYRQQITSRFSVDLAAFYNEYRQLQTFTILPPTIVANGIDPVHVFLPVMFMNNMRGKSDGAEAALSWAISQDLKFALNYTYLNMNLEAINPTTQLPDPAQESAEQLYPEHQYGVKAYWNLNRTWTLDTSVAYVDEVSRGDINSYVRMDINLGHQLSKTVKFNLVGQNLLDSREREFTAASDLNAAEIERSIFAKLSVQF